MLLLVILVIIVGFFTYFLKSNGTFLTANESFQLLQRDTDGYFKSLSNTHLKIRDADTAQDYLNKIVVQNFTKDQKDRLGKCIVFANEFYQNQFSANKYGLKIGKIPWKFALTKGNTYEFGYPHTRTDTIFISDEIFTENDNYITRMMIHEKIHLDQKLNPEKYDKIISDIGLIKKDYRNPERTSNPDINNYDYTGNIKQHPYEEIAYAIENMIK